MLHQLVAAMKLQRAYRRNIAVLRIAIVSVARVSIGAYRRNIWAPP